MIKTGIIGLGRMGLSHFAIANAHPDVELAAVCEPSKFMSIAVGKYTGVKCYKDYKDMIKSEKLDCVLITTPTRFHFEMVQYALEAGLHVFVEKPFCLNPEDGKKLVDLAAEKRVVNQVGYHNRFIGTFNEARRLCETGAIGEVYHVLGEAYGPVVLKEKGKTWRADPEQGGGCLYDYATHVINLMQYIAGATESVSGAVLKSIYSMGVDDAVYGTIHFKDGKTGQLSVNWSDETYRKMSTQLTLLGKKGKIITDAQELKVYFKDEPEAGDNYEKGWNMRWVTDLSPEVGFYLRGEEYSAQIEYFISCVKNNRTENRNSFHEAYNTDCVVDQFKKESKTRQGQ